MISYSAMTYFILRIVRMIPVLCSLPNNAKDQCLRLLQISYGAVIYVANICPFTLLWSREKDFEA